ncbi:hypothetical protein PENTCL1PPCAC_3521, partial [Pristionchus entomophagus]
VGDVVDAAGRVRVLAVNAANLQLEAVAHLLEVGLGRDIGQLDVHRGAHRRAEVRRAEGQVTETLVSGEGRLLLDGLDSLDEAGQHCADIASVLHRDDAQMVLLIDLDEERLRLVVVDAATIGPVAAGVGLLEEAVALLEQ